jgi:hypothetical protein
MIQYSRALVMEPRSRSVLDTRLPGCVKTLTLKLSVEILSGFRRSENHSYWRPLSEEGN